MSGKIYAKLAVTNLKNNRKTYVPYLLTSVLAVMMFHIMDNLQRNDYNEGAFEMLRVMLRYAEIIIGIFAVILLFYTNSFLIKRRKKEIGVYNILGMGKGHIAKMMTIETLITAAVSIIGGLLLGTAFSKLMYLILLKILGYDVRIRFQFEPASLGVTAALFLGIFALTLCYNLIQIRLANPVELLRGGNQGEKEPKTKWLMVILGTAAIAAGYYLAFTIKNPLDAFSWFFVAVLCVIIGTYALFEAGSIALLKHLRKNKKYYYQTKHFTSVSGMIYRMKQNAAGLASICILSTMVMVTVSTTVSLYAGMEDIMRTRYPSEVSVFTVTATEDNISKIKEIVQEEAEKKNLTPEMEADYRYGSFAGIWKEDAISLFEENVDYTAVDVCEIYMIPLEDYNRMTGEQMSLDADEIILFYANEKMWGKDTITMEEKTYHIVKELKQFANEAKQAGTFDCFYMIVPDSSQIREWQEAMLQSGEVMEAAASNYNGLRYRYSVDLDGIAAERLDAERSITERIAQETQNSNVEGREIERESFYYLYGGFFFMGIYLGTMFLLAAVLIIYYKQISEGYDDRERYQIMQKVGMSKREVKRSIHSQILTVFFLPLITAICHVAAAFPMISHLLVVLQMNNTKVYAVCTVVVAAVFAVIYGIVYALTAKEYYRIVE